MFRPLSNIVTYCLYAVKLMPEQCTAIEVTPIGQHPHSPDLCNVWLVTYEGMGEEMGFAFLQPPVYH